MHKTIASCATYASTQTEAGCPAVLMEQPKTDSGMAKALAMGGDQ